MDSLSVGEEECRPWLADQGRFLSGRDRFVLGPEALSYFFLHGRSVSDLACDTACMNLNKEQFDKA